MRKRSQAAGPFARDIAVDLGTSSVVMVMLVSLGIMFSSNPLN